MLLQEYFRKPVYHFYDSGSTGSITGTALIGLIKSNFGWEASFLFFVGFMALAWVTLIVLNIEKQREKIAELEQE